MKAEIPTHEESFMICGPLPAARLVSAALWLTLFWLAVPLCGLGATANVSVVNYAFVPDTTNIFAGDQVIWTWEDGFHSTTSSDSPALWDSGANFSPFAFTNTFTSAGTFSYLCTVHGFTGSISVTAANVPPSVSITNPAPGTVFSAPAVVTIQASASDTDGILTNVRFLIGSTVLTNETIGPFAAVASNLAAGGYTLTAIASDDLDATATNSVNISVVTPVPLVISSPSRPSGTNFQFSYTANAGLGYIVQRSTNLLSTDWITLVTNTAAAGLVNFSDTNAVASPGFYRVGRLPNP
jgi:plastocyanin